MAAAGPARDWAAQLIGAAPNDRAREFVTRLAVEAIEAPRNPTGNRMPGTPRRCWPGWRTLAVSRQIAELKSRLQRLNPAESQDYNRTFGDLVALEQRRKALLDRAAGAL